MSRRAIFWIIATVVLLHVGAFVWLGRMKPLPKSKYVPPANNFGMRQITQVNEKTGERIVTREFNVSTRIITPEELAALQKDAPKREPRTP